MKNIITKHFCPKTMLIWPIKNHCKYYFVTLFFLTELTLNKFYNSRLSWIKELNPGPRGPEIWLYQPIDQHSYIPNRPNRPSSTKVQNILVCWDAMEEIKNSWYIFIFFFYFLWAIFLTNAMVWFETSTRNLLSMNLIFKMSQVLNFREISAVKWVLLSEMH